MKAFNKVSLLVSAAAVIASAFLTAGAHAQKIPVNFGVTFRNARLTPIWIAEDKGFFIKR